MRETNDFIDSVQSQFESGEKTAWFHFYTNGKLIRYLNGYQGNTGDYKDMHIAQSLDLHTVTVNLQGMADFLTYLHEGPFQGYAEFARDEINKSNKKQRRRKR